MFTSVEWFEEGQFEVVQGKVRPLSFLEYRVGADKPHRHSARFDWKLQKIFYENWPTTLLPPGTQDQGSILYALMLNPPAPGTQQTIHISSGKKLRVYRYAHAGTETLKTTLGVIKATVIERPPSTKTVKASVSGWPRNGATCRYAFPPRNADRKRPLSWKQSAAYEVFPGALVWILP